MNKTIKIIDLLIKIANGNDMPLSFRYEGIVWVLKGGRYYQEVNDEVELEKWFEKYLFKSLNEEIEIIEEDKEIEKIEFDEIDEMTDYDIYSYPECEDDSKENFKNKINELIRNQKILIKLVNELKKGK